MNEFQKLYHQKLVTAAEAVKAVRSGDWVDYGWCTGTVRALDEALAARYKELHDVKVRGAVLFQKPAIMSIPDASEHFTWNSWHTSGIERKMIEEGGTFYIPLRYSEISRYYRESIPRSHVAILQVAPMDEQGYFNFGPNTSHMKTMCEMAEIVIVEVNKNMPRCLGGYNEAIHISQVTYVVEGYHPPMWQMKPGAASEIDYAVANLIVPEIPNGACLQLGIGGMPNAVGSIIAQSDLRDLGVHTEMYVDAFVDMARAGKITGAKKSIDTGRQTYTFGAGSQKMYDYLHENPVCMAAPADYVTDARVFSQLDNFISVNTVMDVDLFGQVSAESSGTRHISGAGGQLDFVLGAYLSKGGKSFICCPSTIKRQDGTLVSRIRPVLAEGSIVTDTRANIHYLVTEYGMVNLKGATTWERAERIISVAHPAFREELIAAAEHFHIWRKSSKR